MQSDRQQYSHNQPDQVDLGGGASADEAYKRLRIQDGHFDDGLEARDGCSKIMDEAHGV